MRKKKMTSPLVGFPAQDGEHGFGGAKDPSQVDAAYDSIHRFLARTWGLPEPTMAALASSSRL